MRIYALVGLALVACATPYQRQGLTGGFSESQLGENVFTVRFNGNGFTSGERAVDFTLLRSADLARERGFRYFVIVDRAAGYSYSAYTTPTTSTTTGSATTYGNTTSFNATTTTTGGQTHVIAKPSTMNTIVCFYEKPANSPGVVYDATFVYLSLSSKYGLTKEPLPADAAGGAPCDSTSPCGRGYSCRTDSSGGHCIPLQ